MTATSRMLDEKNTGDLPADQLKAWLQDLDQHGDDLLGAIRAGRVQVTTASGFSELTNRLRAFAQAYADEALQVSALTAQKVVLTNTIFYLLKSCEGIVGQSDKIAELLALLPIGQGLDAKALLPLLMDGKKRDAIFQNLKSLGGAFEASWLTRIDVTALAPVLQDAGINFSAYIQLAEVLRRQLPSEPQTETLEIPHGEAAH